MLHQVQQAIQYTFNTPELLVVALTHSSATNEQAKHKEHNERLEFLGDAVLELCVSHELFNRFSQAREGQLTAMRSKMVNQDVLAQIGRDIGLDKWIILGKGEESQGGRERDALLSDCVEAVLGAIFLDGGLHAAQNIAFLFFEKIWMQMRPKERIKDAKSYLQEISQQIFKERPKYTLQSSTGPEHSKKFTIQLELPNGEQFTGTDSSVKRAEQDAAQQGLNYLNNLEVEEDTKKE